MVNPESQLRVNHSSHDNLGANGGNKSVERSKKFERG